jgi:hypothetical protein
VRTPLPLSTTFAAISLVLGGIMVAWVAGPINQADDAAAFEVALLGIVALPVSLAAAVAGLLPRAEPRVKCALVGAVAAAGIAGTAPLAGVMIADDPSDPAWIDAFVWIAPFALAVAAVLAGVALYRVLRGVRLQGRLALTVPLAVASAVVTALTACQTMPAILGVVALPVVLLVMRRRRRRAVSSAA